LRVVRLWKLRSRSDGKSCQCISCEQEFCLCSTFVGSAVRSRQTSFVEADDTPLLYVPPTLNAIASAIGN